MAQKKRKKSGHRTTDFDSGEIISELRIVGGEFRGRKLAQLPREGTRPMKHRVREAIFNLIGFDCKNRHALDLFGGTGAIGLEALSRGAKTATLIECHIPVSRIVQENIKSLAVGERTELLVMSAFLWQKRDLPECAEGRPSKAAVVHTEAKDAQTVWIGAGKPWIAFCSPPYDFFVEKHEQMMVMISDLLQAAPSGSTVVIESDERFDFADAPTEWKNSEGETESAEWDVRTYAPAVVGVIRKG